MEPKVGFGPTTYSLRKSYSTPELLRQEIGLLYGIIAIKTTVNGYVLTGVSLIRGGVCWRLEVP